MAKKKFTVEYSLGHTAPSRLWNHLQSDTGLEGWFADRVELDEKDYTFYWGEAEQHASLISMRRDVYVRYRWWDDEPHAFFEMRIIKSELTDETTLIITDFASDPDDQDELIDLWDQQIENLKRILGVN
jgi:hypothetical protein